MIRFLLRPWGGVIAFVVLACLVLGGLLYVTCESLRIEAEQLEAIRQNEAANHERLALWQLDSRLFPALAIETNRPYTHYQSFAPTNSIIVNEAKLEQAAPSQLPSPLLSAELPDWMRLHFQLDADAGWTSPQVPNNRTEQTLIEELANDVQLPNVDAARRDFLKQLAIAFPHRTLFEKLRQLQSGTPDQPIPTAVTVTLASHDSNRNLDRSPADLSKGAKGGRPALAPKTPENPTTDNAVSAKQQVQTPASGTPPPQFSQAYRQMLERSDNLRRGLEDAKSYSPDLGNTLQQSDLSRNRTLPTPLPPNSAITREKPVTPLPQLKQVDPDKTQQNSFRKVALAFTPPSVQVGIIRPVWFESKTSEPQLVLLRAVEIDRKTVYQGVVLDWPKLRETLLAEVRESFPESTLVPVRDAGTASDRQLVTIPVRFEPGKTATASDPGWTPLRVGLAISWLAVLVGLAGTAFAGTILISHSEQRIRFVSAVTHELRTPLTSMRLYLDLLTSGLVTDEAKSREYLNTLSAESERLNRLIENVLDFAKLERRTASVQWESLTIESILSELHSTWAERLRNEKKELHLIATVSHDQRVRTDSRILQQILSNFLDNARKYSRDAIDPRIWVWVKPARVGSVLFVVEDRGPGIAQTERGSIFRAFRRGRTADTTAGGAGLGMALASQWATLLGGTLSYRPADGGTGACFELEIPMDSQT